MPYYSTMEDGIIDQEDDIGDEFEIDDTRHDEQEDGIISAMMGFEQGLEYSYVIAEVLYQVKDNNNAIIGVMSAMASMGIGGSVATLRGMESADDIDLSFGIALEAIDKQRAFNVKGIFHTLESWKTNKLAWFKNAPTRLYANVSKWAHLVDNAPPAKMDIAAEIAKAKVDYARTHKWMMRWVKINNDLGAKGIALDKRAESMTDLAAKKEAHDKAQAFFRKSSRAGDMIDKLDIKRKELDSLLVKLTEEQRAYPTAAKSGSIDTVSARGWSVSRLKDILSQIKARLRPTATNNALRSAVTAAADSADTTSIASRFMKFVSSHFRSWWVIAAAVAAAVIGVCVAIWRVYKKNNKEEAEKLEQEGEQIKEKALREAHAAYK